MRGEFGTSKKLVKGLTSEEFKKLILAIPKKNTLIKKVENRWTTIFASTGKALLQK